MQNPAENPNRTEASESIDKEKIAQPSTTEHAVSAFAMEPESDGLIAQRVAHQKIDEAEIRKIEDRLGIPNRGKEDGEEENSHENLEDDDTIERILESDSAEDLERLRSFHSLSLEQVNIYSEMAKLRKGTLMEIRQRFKERIISDPEPSEEEWKMGVFKEELEPQVFEAVTTLRKKGYNTNESGFYGPEKQLVGFARELPVDFTLSPEAERLLDEKGLTIKISAKTIELHYGRSLGIEALKEAWNIIAENLPDLGRPDEAADTGAVESFKRRVENIKRNPDLFLAD
ncbi:MAG: hypothetical protein WCO05_04560 [Candidatus Moraniibacteriota bacterium]